ncbi:ATPase associated with various cellular activities (AAA) family protein, putative [Babesia bigemina]|uniref:Midasin n=1 Tax=Babesia bigemina TaxID=5866 RepID=A0A061D6X6_BABBI|nr:ATPase associated with various cellular activities (AAA) family protein, putative [Babesia bigemina]CDR96456.1 ATPase associated with various cellular activities (AAA) family protein, putative [Babesia bigemina]|eukprot:XP_012768642.1 ATPase associated with various cellular activities (AAA) family protein, putative [Babesia bigemina]
MDEFRVLNAYCTRIANCLSSSASEEADSDLNEVVSNFELLVVSSDKSSPATTPFSGEKIPSSVLRLFGASFYSEKRFRCLSKLCALSITRSENTDISAGWYKVRFVVWSCLLNPFTASDVTKEVPDLVLSVLVDFVHAPLTSADNVVERLVLLWRLRRDARLRRAANRALYETLNRDDTSDMIELELKTCKDDTDETSPYRLQLLRILSEILRAPAHRYTTLYRKVMDDVARYGWFVPVTSDDPNEGGDFCELHISVSASEFADNTQSNLIRIGKRVSYLRSPDVVTNDSFVELDYSSEVLSSMLCHVDVHIGSVVMGDCCKEFHIRELARRLGIASDSISRIYTDESTDVKALIGQWVCTDKVGEFKFSYGILSTAMRLGRWLIFDENLSESIACLLYSVCQLGRVIIPELNEVVEASSNFHVFITARNIQSLTGSLKHLPRTYVPPLSESDCVEIACKRWSEVTPICGSLVSAFFSLRESLCKHRGFNFSDLFKILHRLATSGVSFDGYLSSATKGVMLEAFYCVVLASMSCDEQRNGLLGDVAEHFGVLPSASYDVLPLNQIKAGENTRVHMKVLHQLMSCYLCNEPVLLVGETGTGKTAIIQHFAKVAGKTLKVYVFSEQSEADDLLGSFFPDNIADVCSNIFSRALNVILRSCVVEDALLCYLDHLVELYRQGQYARILSMLSSTLTNLMGSATTEMANEATTLRVECNMRCGGDAAVKHGFKLSHLQQPLESLPAGVMAIFEKYTSSLKSSGPQLHFKFEEGLLVRAMREGWWILLDEVNLAPSDLLQRFVGVLSNVSNKFELYECENRVVDIHEDFRLFACMNPPTIRKGDFVTFTSGKKELPANFRSHMTEIFVDEIDTLEDVSIVVGSYVDPDDRSVPSAELCHFYLKVIELCRNGELEDGSFKSPTFTLRNLVRTLHYMQHVMQRSHRPLKDGRAAFVEGALACFASSLGSVSFSKVESLLPSLPSRTSTSFEESVDYVRVEGYWIRRGGEPIHRQEQFIVTPNISKNLRRLCRILSGLRVPVLLEGPTASGKTSLVQYLCSLTGHRCVRINNHEHTDLSEYLGQFVFDSVSCQLKFNYGPIITAMKEGHWAILDELNLAPSQILEALNRILDDNREVYVPETGETIKSHPEFMIFATQNPANSIYGGRKQLSKAFCNRFVQLYIEGLDTADLQQVLHQRCAIPLSRAEKIVSAFQTIQSCPMNSMAFERHSVLITLRDLIKWANRVRSDDEGLAYYGWCVIAEKLRNPVDQETVKGILERCCLLSKPNKPKELVINFEADKFLRSFLESSGLSTYDLCARERYLWFDGSTSRLVALLLCALEHREPVLLVGETGIGKTTICQLLAKIYNRRLNILNLSKNTEASDFIGSFRPIRSLKSFHSHVGMLIDYFEDDVHCSDLEYLREVMTTPLSQVDRSKFMEVLGRVSSLLKSDANVAPEKNADRDAKRQKMKSSTPESIRVIISQLMRSFSNQLFEWVDGPLTSSMELGEWFLADEISLADDAVLEKMNSVLEADSTLTIPEAGGSTLRMLRAHSDFRFLATMNPSGDHGKRELSPALLNRFTVIYIPTPDFENYDVIRRVLENCGGAKPDWVASSMAAVIRLYNERCPHQKLTLRDVIKWAEFMGEVCSLDTFLQGAHVVFLDNMVAGASGVSLRDVVEIVSRYLEDVNVEGVISSFNDNTWVHKELDRLGVPPLSSIASFTLGSKSSLCMVGKILRALKVNRPILLEGQPGVGKSASISALASLHGTKLVRVNLSEHTDIMDLFGSDIPRAVDGNWKFVWHNGPVIDAAINGYWVVLDELNLASQQVLEGLNALLDHRRETFIPELDRFVKCHENFRLFASQNSAVDGGGRKHLPKSFLNRFTKIYFPPLDESDCCAVLEHLYTTLPAPMISRLVNVLFEIRSNNFGKGVEWNLRDCMRFCQSVEAGIPSSDFDDAFRFTFMSRLDSKDMVTAIASSIGLTETQMVPHVTQPSAWCQANKTTNEVDMHVDTSTVATDKCCGASRSSFSYEPIWMQSQEDVCITVSMAASLNFPVLLLGPSLSGKQSVIKCVASRCEQQLTEITMLPCFDISDLLGGFEQVGNTEGNVSSVTFRWVDSPLVESIERGNWVLLTRIHNANPAILDRLNSLLEVGGTLTLNESGDCNRVIRPHPNFRIFMTADSVQVGKISKAFRNRCLEVSMNYPNCVRQLPTPIPQCSFMEQLCNQISDYVASLQPPMAEGGHEVTRDVSLKCSEVIDGARLLKSFRNYTWHDCVLRSFCSAVLGSYLTQLSSGAYNHANWLFLKHWAMIDQPLDQSLCEASAFFSRELQVTALKVLECCLDWCSVNQTTHEDSGLNLVTDFLERCTAFENRVKRDATAARLDDEHTDSDKVFWFILRSSSTNYNERYSMVEHKLTLTVSRSNVDTIFSICQRSSDNAYELQTLLHMFLFDSLRMFDVLGTSNYTNALVDYLVNTSVKGESVLPILSKMQFLFYLLLRDGKSAPETIDYLTRKVYNELLEMKELHATSGTAMGDVRGAVVKDDFMDYSTVLVGSPIYDEVALALELHRYGMGDVIACQRNIVIDPKANITSKSVLDFVDAYVSGAISDAESLEEGKRPALFMRHVESPNAALYKFVIDRIRFLGCWLCHQLLMGEVDSKMLHKAHDYALGLLNLHVQLQGDLPSSSIAVVSAILVSLRRLMSGADPHSCVYDVMLETWSLQDITGDDLKLDAVQYMVDLVDGSDLGVKRDDSVEAPPVESLDTISGVMLFWDGVSKENGLPSLRDNIRRIELLRGMLSEHMPAPQWSGLFATLYLVSPIVSKALHLDCNATNGCIKTLYASIVRDEPPQTDIIAAFKHELTTDHDATKHNPTTDAYHSDSTVQRLSAKVVEILSALTQASADKRMLLLKDLWRICGLLLLAAMPNTSMIITELRKGLDIEYRNSLSMKLKRRLDAFVTCDTLSDGEVRSSYQFLTEKLEELAESNDHRTFSLRFYASAENVNEGFGSLDTVAVMRRMQRDLVKFVHENLKLGGNYSVRCDHHCLSNFKRYLLRQYVLLPEIVRPLLVGLDCLAFGLPESASDAPRVIGNVPRSLQLQRVSQRCMQFPLNLLKRVDQGDLLSLGAHFYDSGSAYDVFCYLKCMVASVRHDLLQPPSMEPLKYVMLLLSGISSRLKTERAEGQAMRMSLLQSCMAMAQKRADKGVYDLFPSQQEIVRAIVRDCGPLEEYESLEQDEEEPVAESEQTRDIRRINVLCKLLSLAVAPLETEHSEKPDAETADGDVKPEDELIMTRTTALPSQRVITQQMNASLCLAMACGTLSKDMCSSEESVFISRRLMKASEEHFGYSGDKVEGSSTSFYNTVDIPFCLKAGDILERLSERVKALLDQFGSQQQLLDISVMLTSMNKMKIPSVTQVLLVTLLENLVARVHKWNSISHSGISLNDLASELESLILEMRHRELKGWYSAIDDRVSSVRQDAYSYLVYFTEMCSDVYDSNVPLPTRVSKIVGEILQCVLAAPVAHFEPILGMLETVVQLYRDSTLPTEVVMRTVMENVLWFLMLWIPTVTSHISSLKKETRKEVSELVRRINWSGNDYLSISALLQKQKVHMSSVMRKFQEAIMQPFSSVYTPTPDQWCDKVIEKSDDGLHQQLEDVPKESVDSEESRDETTESADASESLLLDSLRSNVEYVRKNKNEISRVQITRLTGEIGRLLGEMGYSAVSGHDIGDWIRWLDLGASMKSHGCTAAEEARGYIMRSLHIMFDLHESFRADKDKFEYFSRNVDTNIFGYLVTMLRSAHNNIQHDVAEFERCNMTKSLGSIFSKAPVYELDSACFEQLLSSVDDIYDTALQANDADLLSGYIADSKSPSDGADPIANSDNPLWARVAEFRCWLEGTDEMSVHKCSTRTKSPLFVSGKWLEGVTAFCDDVEQGAGYPAQVLPFFRRDASRIRYIVANAKPISQLPVIESVAFCAKDPNLPLACLYMAQLIDCISRVTPPAEEGKQESREEWNAGTGLEDGTGAKNVSDEVDPEEGMFDNFKNETAPEHGDVQRDNPAVDVDMEFEGDVLDLENSRECSDIEEDENVGHNDEFEDLQKQRLDADLAEDDPSPENDGEPLDIHGSSTKETKDVADDPDAAPTETAEGDNDYTSEVDKQQDAPQQQSHPADEHPEQLEGIDETEDGDGDGEAADGQSDAGDAGDEDASGPDPGLDLGENDLEIDGDEGGDVDRMDEDAVDDDSQEKGESMDDPMGEGEAMEEDTVSPDGPEPRGMFHRVLSPYDDIKRPLISEITCPREARSRRDYHETPYGVEGKSDSQIRNEDYQGTGGNSYEEDSHSGAFWGETARTQGGSMLSFLDTIQRLDNPSGQHDNENVKARNIIESMSDGNNKSENESMLNELDDSSNLEGISASMDGSAAPNIDLMDVSLADRNTQESSPMDVCDELADQSSTSDKKSGSSPPKDDAIRTDDHVDSDANDMGPDVSAVMRGTVTFDVSGTPPDLPSKAPRSSSDVNRSAAYALWHQYRDETSAISTNLCEQMRMILEPSLKSSLQGDYKTGKRISIKKLMAFIASNYQRDKIWLRRSKPNKRDNRVVLAMDNSRSMAVSNAGNLALKSFACIYQAMSVLEVGELSVCKFGGDVPEMLLEMDGSEDPCNVVAGMTFDEESRHSHETGLPELMKYVLRYLEHQKERRKILVIISDGKFNKEKARPWIQAVISNQVVPLLVILDPVTSNQRSIMQMKQVREINGKLTVETFLSNFPFPYYAVIQNLDRLPSILSDLLRVQSLLTFFWLENGRNKKSTAFKMRFKILSFLFLICGLLAAFLPSTISTGAKSIIGGIGNAAFRATNVINSLGSVMNIAGQTISGAGTIAHGFKRMFTDVDNGTNPINFGGGNLGAYYNFMYPDNDDYPWACVCNGFDLEKYYRKEQPYVRCRNQEDLSFHNYQANCDPESVSNKPF